MTDLATLGGLKLMSSELMGQLARAFLGDLECPDMPTADNAALHLWRLAARDHQLDETQAETTVGMERLRLTTCYALRHGFSDGQIFEIISDSADAGQLLWLAALIHVPDDCRAYLRRQTH